MSLEKLTDLDLGGVRVKPRSRSVESGDHSVALEPLVMQVLITLARQAGMVVSRRELFDSCWGATPVGDDSLNRTINILRKRLKQVAGDSIQVETVPGTGYTLRLSGGDSTATNQTASRQRSLEVARNSWRRGLPEVDHLAIEQLRQFTAVNSDDPATWGMLALLLRYAAEYAEPTASADFVDRCEAAAARATELDKWQPEAHVALATVAPLFGRWRDAGAKLRSVIASNPHCAPAIHELAIVEMATGRVSEAKRLMDGLIIADPLAACFAYKSIWQHWSVGDILGMDQTADRAIQLWPAHPAVWTARFWTLAHTDRASAALRMLEDIVARPNIPQPMLRLLHSIANSATTRESGKVAETVESCRLAAQRGPAFAVVALLGLGLFDAIEEWFDVAFSYYARAGDAPVPIRHVREEASINDQHRRVTQPLFTPAAAIVRADRRFGALCDRIGLANYWNETGNRPDFESCSTA